MRAFRGCRPRGELAERVAAPPYDVLSSDEARRLVQGNPDSFLRVSKAEVEFGPEVPPDDDRVYERARSNLEGLFGRGVVHRDPLPCLYLYRLVMQGRAQLGVVGAVSVAAYEAGWVKKHELTRPDKENDRTRHAEVLGAHTGPVFLTYRADPEIDRLVAEALTREEPVCDFTAADGVRHTLWVVADGALVAGLEAAFDSLGALYVADGHHRSAAAARIWRSRAESGVGGADRFLAAIFPDDQVRILDYNRVVRDLNGLSEAEFKKRVGERFFLAAEVEPVRPSKPHEFGMFLADGWFRLTLRPGLAEERDPLGRLDVGLLEAHILGPILGITDPRRDHRLDFVGGIRGLGALSQRVLSGEMAVAFSLYPTALADVMAVADAGLVMPPKSTWFEPKLRDGLVFLEF
ncbi:MAG: DUF1015 domain-containing protein [Magnetococcales bacterium]|nr:DUF1015 domain-containing protein [Magnetococcales bacterium]MBF0156172.1 DUF1015 domain-containing protein [Magnetococcales bacterium]